jgi:hypothetical protein
LPHTEYLDELVEKILLLLFFALTLLSLLCGFFEQHLRRRLGDSFPFLGWRFAVFGARVVWCWSAADAREMVWNVGDGVEGDVVDELVLAFCVFVNEHGIFKGIRGGCWGCWCSGRRWERGGGR